MAKLLGSTSFRHRSDVFTSDRCLIDVDPERALVPRSLIYLTHLEAIDNHCEHARALLVLSWGVENPGQQGKWRSHTSVPYRRPCNSCSLWRIWKPNIKHIIPKQNIDGENEGERRREEEDEEENEEGGEEGAGNGGGAGNSPVTGVFPSQMASNAEMFPFDDVIMVGRKLVTFSDEGFKYPSLKDYFVFTSKISMEFVPMIPTYDRSGQFYMNRQAIQ